MPSDLPAPPPENRSADAATTWNHAAFQAAIAAWQQPPWPSDGAAVFSFTQLAPELLDVRGNLPGLNPLIPLVIDAAQMALAAPPTLCVSIAVPTLRHKAYRFASLQAAGSRGTQNEPSHGVPPPPARRRPANGPQPDGPLAASASRQAPPAPPARYTRVKPPGDLVKLEDRLYCLLQPPLEVVAGMQELAFPCQPFPYQLEGVAFLYPRAAAVLADEMGLGKTVQAITAIRLLIHAGEVRQVLVVCPKPLVSNWQRELGRWAPELPVLVVEGDAGRRAWQWRQEGIPVRIANYELLQRDGQQALAAGASFDLVVLDEAQRIKNRNSLTSQLVRALPRARSWALTGTPVENSAEDLVGIFEFVMPGYLSPDMKLHRLGRLAGEYVLRRTKEQVLADLPPRLVREAYVELGPAQREAYRLAEERGVLRLAGLGAECTIRHVFELVLRLKQICNFDPATGESAKLERLQADLEEVAASGQKALVFSQYVETLETLRARLAAFQPLVYHGRVPHREREGVLARFRTDSRRHLLLLSYGAGGVGLNLQCAQYVFLFDRWWNPAVEDQAINRAHRIGATGPLTVTRFLTIDTIEERIDQVLQHKRELFQTILSNARPCHLSLTPQELFGLFRMSPPAQAAPPPSAAAGLPTDRPAAA
jgi:SNF2 family DNA or RNA helicase